jgi:hypothetical protein
MTYFHYRLPGRNGLPGQEFKLIAEASDTSDKQMTIDVFLSVWEARTTIGPSRYSN